MLEKRNILKSQFLLTADEKVALVEAKLARAEAYMRALAEHAKLLEKAQARK